jgi:hypothetical protein
MIKIISPLDQVDNSATFTVGTRVVNKEGNEYIYLPGTTSVAQYDWVAIRTAAGPGLSYGSVTRLVYEAAGTDGMVGIAQGAIVSNKYGWFLIKGTGWGNCGDTCSSGSPIYASGTTANVTTTVTTNSLVYGAICVQDGASGGTVKVSINHPQTYGIVA